MPDFEGLYRKHNDQMEDFWSRRANAPKHTRTISIFGHSVLFDSNHANVLDAATLAEPLYSTADWRAEPGWRVHLTVRQDLKPVPLPARPADLMRYTGADDWLSIDLREWGNCFVDMKRGEAFAILSPSFAGQPEQVCLLMVNTILTNLITRHGYSMLHASALVKDDRVLLLQAPHGTGKSTTALRLLANGFKLLCDSMVYIGEREGQLWLGGFPVGRIKLREDMLPFFPALADGAEEEPVRDETKYRVELKRVNPSLVAPWMVPVRRVEYCLLERWDKSESRVEPLTEVELWPDIMVNSLHYDSPELWRENLGRIEMLLQHANLHRLRIGASEGGIIQAVNNLW